MGLRYAVRGQQPRAEAAPWGGNTLVEDDDKTAVIPDSVRTGEKWFNDGVWKDHFIPSTAQIQSALLDTGKSSSRATWR